MEKLNFKAQSVMEYLLVLAVVTAVLILAGAYYKRSLQGKFRQSIDVIGGGEQAG